MKQAEMSNRDLQFDSYFDGAALARDNARMSWD